jgi:hypothetical protein
LSDLGVDIFANHNYDTWVLHTIYRRLVNNARGSSHPTGRHMVAIQDLYTFFNQSCMSKALRNGSITETVEGTPEMPLTKPDTVRLTAKAKIAKGEEIYVSYYQDDHLKTTLKERKRDSGKLFVWTVQVPMLSAT